MDEKGSYALQTKETLERELSNGRISFDAYLNGKHQLAMQQNGGYEDSTYSVKGRYLAGGGTRVFVTGLVNLWYF